MEACIEWQRLPDKSTNEELVKVAIKMTSILKISLNSASVQIAFLQDPTASTGLEWLELSIRQPTSSIRNNTTSLATWATRTCPTPNLQPSCQTAKKKLKNGINSRIRILSLKQIK